MLEGSKYSEGWELRSKERRGGGARKLICQKRTIKLKERKGKKKLSRERKQTLNVKWGRKNGKERMEIVNNGRKKCKRWEGNCNEKKVKKMKL